MMGTVHALPIATPAKLPTRHELVLDGIGKSFGGKSVLSQIDLAIPAGQFVAIVGRSGGGKTTLMRLIAGLDTPDSGSIRIGGEVGRGLRREVRLMFQDARLLPWQRVAANVGIARGLGWRKRAQQRLDEVGLGERAKEWPHVLSGGQRQRVALARALMTEPSLLLLDEPFGALDAMTRSEMHRLLTRVWLEHGFTALLITHDVAEAVALADRVIVLRDGVIAEDIAVPNPRTQHGPHAADLQRRILEAV